ncbi:hypothetical protein C8J56DRAFT_890452 [Mycena floridula]|nr:hypothetical protein C8J56DRAFT_890452 [Mycena floridula]
MNFLGPTNDASIAWTFSDHAVDLQQFRTCINPQWLRARLDQATDPASSPVAIATIHVSVDPHVDLYAGMPSLADMSDSDEVPYDSDSDSDSDDGIPPLIDLSNSDSGYDSD